MEQRTDAPVEGIVSISVHAGATQTVVAGPNAHRPRSGKLLVWRTAPSLEAKSGEGETEATDAHAQVAVMLRRMAAWLEVGDERAALLRYLADIAHLPRPAELDRPTASAASGTEYRCPVTACGEVLWAARETRPGSSEDGMLYVCRLAVTERYRDAETGQLRMKEGALHSDGVYFVVRKGRLVVPTPAPVSVRG